MHFYLSVDINGVDIKGAVDAGEVLGIPGVFGGFLGLGAGAALQDKAGDFGEATLIYWPVCTIIGIIVTVWIWKSII
jgi:hypothetical protein